MFTVFMSKICVVFFSSTGDRFILSTATKSTLTAVNEILQRKKPRKLGFNSLKYFFVCTTLLIIIKNFARGSYPICC